MFNEVRLMHKVINISDSLCSKSDFFLSDRAIDTSDRQYGCYYVQFLCVSSFKCDVLVDCEHPKGESCHSSSSNPSNSPDACRTAWFVFVGQVKKKKKHMMGPSITLIVSALMDKLFMALTVSKSEREDNMLCHSISIIVCEQLPFNLEPS